MIVSPRIADNLALARGFVVPAGLLAGAFIVGLVLFAVRGISMDGQSWQTVGLLLAISSALVAVAITLAGRRATAAAMSLALFLLLPAPLAIFSYASAALGTPLPLRDGLLAAADAAIWFDWPSVVALFNLSPSLIWVLERAYHGTIVPIIYALVLLNVLGRPDRIVRFLSLFIGTCLLAALISGLVPAVGAYVYFAPAADIRSAIPADAGVWHLAHFEALRAGTFKSFSLAQTEGLVTFPSFHTAAAVAIPLALGGLGVVTALAWCVAGVIVVSTIPIGGHYLIDVIAGIAMTVALHRLLILTGVGESALGSIPRPRLADTQPAASAA